MSVSEDLAIVIFNLSEIGQGGGSTVALFRKFASIGLLLSVVGTGVTFWGESSAQASAPSIHSVSSTTPLPDDAEQNQPSNYVINDLACTSPETCIAVGSYQYGNTGTAWLPFIDVESNGTWQAAFQPQFSSSAPPNATGSLQSVSCSSAGNCVAVGGLSETSLGGSGPFVVTQVQGTWSQGSFVSLPANAHIGSLSAVACLSSSSCVATGSYETQAPYQSVPFSVSMSSGTWSNGQAIDLPNDRVSNNPNGQLNSVSCSSASSCVAVGFYSSTSGQVPLVASGTIASLATATSISLGDSFNSSQTSVLTSVSCAPNDSCSATGVGTLKAGSSGAVILTNATGTWKPAAVVPEASLISISCVSATSCSAVGSNGSSPTNAAVLISATGSGWGNPVSLSLPTGALSYSGATGSAIACSTTSNCTIAESVNGNATNAFVATVSHGEVANPSPLPAPVNIGRSERVGLSSSVCVSDSLCFSASSYSNLSRKKNVVVSRHSYGVVESQTVLLRDYTGSIEAMSISCTSSQDCLLILGLTNGSTVSTLAYVETSGMWSSSSPVESGIELRQVSCVLNTTYCMAVGWNQTTNRAVSIEYSDSTWGTLATTTSPLLSGGHPIGNQFNAVDCVAVGQCRALNLVGQLNASVINYVYQLIDGVWTVGPYYGYAANGTSQLVLRTISCVTITTCAIAGDANGTALTAELTSKYATLLGAVIFPSSYGQPATITSVSCRVDTCLFVGSAHSVATGSDSAIEFTGSITPGSSFGTNFSAHLVALPVSNAFGWGLSAACGVSGSGCLTTGAYETFTPNDMSLLYQTWYSGVSQAPTITSVMPSPYSARITIAPPSYDGGSRITGYRYYYTLNSNRVLIGTSSSTVFTATQLPNGATLGFTVEAVNAAGSSPESSSVSATLPSLPTAPSSLVAMGVGTTVTATWQAATSMQGPVTGYTAYLVTSASSVNNTTTSAKTCTTTTTSCVFTKLVANTSYWVWVSAANADGSTSSTAVMTKTTVKTASAPTVVRSLAAKPGSSAVTLSWKAPTQVGLGIDHYEVCQSVGSSCTSSATVAGGTTSYVVGNLLHVTKYSFQIVAVEVNGLRSPPAKIDAKTTK